MSVCKHNSFTWEIVVVIANINGNLPTNLNGLKSRFFLALVI